MQRVSARRAKCDGHSVVFILVFLSTSGVKSKVKGEGISSWRSLKSLCMDVLKRFSPASTGHDEPEEQFVLTIYEVSGNGSIDGLRSNITITIAKHGFPNGVFRFQNTATKTFTEPTSVALSEHFTVVRNQGTQGTINVSKIKGIVKLINNS